MAAQPAPSGARRTPAQRRWWHRSLPADERRGWLSHGLAALAISALGLAIAGSVSLTTSAQPIAAPAPVADVVQADQVAGAGPVAGSDEAGAGQAAGSGQATGGTVAGGPSQSRTTLPGSTPTQDPDPATAGNLASFGRAVVVVETTRSPQLQAAVVRERAAQRAETLAESAEQISQAARDAGGAARSQDLVTTERATRQAAVKLAQQRLAEAIRQRVAAETERQGASTSTTTNQTAAPGSTGDTGLDTATVPAGGGSSSPVPGAVIGAHFGQYGLWSRYHTGLDFRASYGTPIRAVADGVVLYAGNSGDWAGNHVAIRHAGGVTTMSSHMSSMAVAAGQSVKAGQVIGYVGQTGRAFGAHLHFELYPVGVKYGDVYKAVNPVPWLRSIGVNVN